MKLISQKTSEVANRVDTISLAEEGATPRASEHWLGCLIHGEEALMPAKYQTSRAKTLGLNLT